MTNSQHLNVAHRMIRRRPEAKALPGDGAGGLPGGGGAPVNINPSPSPTTTPASSPSPSPTSTSVQQSPSTSPPPQPQPQKPTTTSSKNAPPPTTSSTPPPTTKADTPTSTSSKANPTTSASSTSSSSSTSSVASTTSHSSTTAVVPTNNAILGNTPTNLGLGASSFANVQPTDLSNNDPGTTVVADPVNTSGATGISAGSIVGIVVGVLLGLGLVAICIMYLIRRVRRSRRYVQRHESDFGTFNRSAFVREKEPSLVPDMTERSHNVAPSLSGEAMSAAVGAATPPSQALAAANATGAAHAALQERPKYVFGQPAQDGNEHDAATEDDASENAGGVYSSQPVMQMEYNPEAYGSYAKYEDVAHTGGYQDAQREYQGQQGYQGYYDQQGYTDHQGYAVGGYDHQQHQAYIVPDGGQYDYSAQHAQYAASGGGAYETQQQEAYQQPHPYANNSAIGGGHDAAYGGM